MLVDGKASVLVQLGDSADSEATEVNFVGPGDVVGELAMIDGEPRSATVRAKGGPVTVLSIDGQRFRGRLLYRPDLAPSLMATMAQRLRDATRRAAS